MNKILCPLFFLTLTVTLFSADSPPPAKLALTVSTPNSPVYLKDKYDMPQLTYTITNQGDHDATLVHPGDGSEHGMRTPVIGWSILPEKDTHSTHPDQPPRSRIPRCGNRNGIQTKEIFTLPPKQSIQLTRYGFSSHDFEKAGKYRVVFYYQNIPDLKPRGLAYQDNLDALEQIKASTPCLLKSNEIIIEVLDKEPGED